MKNAIILAAGKSSSFAPFTYERPKGLFCVKGEILIERQIEQLHKAGIYEIYVVVGYMKEKFFYLEEKYGVVLLVNNQFSLKGNLYSLFVARNYLQDTFICCGDHYFLENPFLDENEQNISYRACMKLQGKFLEFGIEYSDANVITDFSIGGCDGMAMVGHAYFNQRFSRIFCDKMEKEIDDFGVKSMFWEEFYAKHQKSLTLYIKEYDAGMILEFDSIKDLRRFDSEFLLNVNSEIIGNITKVLKCEPNDIVDIQVIQAGLTNVSFSFDVHDTKYVYRHPGTSAGNMVDRKTELLAQKVAKDIGIDSSIIYMDAAGWKISYFIEDTVAIDFQKDKDDLKRSMAYLRKLHKTSKSQEGKVFDDFAEGMKLMKIASCVKGDLIREFHDLIVKVQKLDSIVKEENNEKVLCHNDVYEPNFLKKRSGELYLIDWEYAGWNDPANDIASILCRTECNEDMIREYFELYYERTLTVQEYCHALAYVVLCGFYWFCWGLYKGSVGDDDGFFFLPAYRTCVKYADKALEEYKKMWEEQN